MDVLEKPIITEKFTELGETKNQYGFICHPKATKPEIKKEVERIYDVKVDKVSTMLYHRENKVRYTKTNIINGKKPNYKKAVVKLKQGSSIDFYSNI